MERAQGPLYTAHLELPLCPTQTRLNDRSVRSESEALQSYCESLLPR